MTQKGTDFFQRHIINLPQQSIADYISNVLPELGEETVPETSIEQILLDVKITYINTRIFFDQVTELLENPTPDSLSNGFHTKASFEFISLLDKFILYMENKQLFQSNRRKLTNIHHYSQATY